MRRELRQIPPAPRRAALLVLLGHRWPMFALGAVLLVTGCMGAWLMFLARGVLFSDQRRLDQGPTERLTAHIEQVDEPVRQGTQPVRWPDGEPRQAIHYSFRYGGQLHRGQSFVPLGSYERGTAIAIELVPGEPRCNRIIGGILFLERGFLQPGAWLGTLAVPGALLLLGWLASVFQLHKVLVHGDAAIASIDEVRLVPAVVPQMLRVRFRFRDHRAVERAGCHWVRLHSELGARLWRQQRGGSFDTVPVLHDRMFPQWNRLLLPRDFAPPPPVQVDPGLQVP